MLRLFSIGICGEFYVNKKLGGTRSLKNAKISVVTTAWNEDDNIANFHSSVCNVLEGVGCSNFEILVVDNGSQDQTLEILKQLGEADPHLKYVSLSRNFGHQGGLMAGMDFCTGDVAITMDADMQHPPSAIPRLLEQWQSGYDVVGTMKATNPDSSLFRRGLNLLFYNGLSKICGLPLNEHQSDFRLLDRVALEALNELPEKSKFLRGLSQWIGFRQKTITYMPALRHAGKTKFTFQNLLSFTMRGVLSFSIVPLRVFTLVGVVVAIGTAVYGISVILKALFSAPDDLPSGWASLTVVISFLGSIQLIGIGVIGEYVGRILSEVHSRPAYIIRETSLDNDK